MNGRSTLQSTLYLEFKVRSTFRVEVHYTLGRQSTLYLDFKVRSTSRVKFKVYHTLGSQSTLYFGVPKDTLHRLGSNKIAGNFGTQTYGVLWHPKV